MEKGRVTQHGDIALGDAGLGHAVRYPNAGPHASAGVYSAKRWQKGQGVTANVAVDHQAKLVGYMEYAAVRAARAEDRRARR